MLLNTRAQRAAIVSALRNGLAVHIERATIRKDMFNLTDFFDINGKIVRADYSLRAQVAAYSILTGSDVLAFKDRYGLPGFLNDVPQPPTQRPGTEADGFVTVWAPGVSNGRV